LRVLQNERASLLELPESLLRLPAVVEGFAQHRVIADCDDPADRAGGADRLHADGERKAEGPLSVAKVAAIEIFDAVVEVLRGDRVAELGPRRPVADGEQERRECPPGREPQPAS